MNNHSSWSSPVPPRACDVLGQVAMEALEGLHRGGEHRRQEHHHHQTQHFLHQRNCSSRYLDQCHYVKKTSPPTCFHIDHPCIVELTCHWQEVGGLSSKHAIVKSRGKCVPLCPTVPGKGGKCHTARVQPTTEDRCGQLWQKPLLLPCYFHRLAQK